MSDQNFDLNEALKEAVILGKPELAIELAKLVIQTKSDPIIAFEKGLKAGITVVGDGFARGELFLPDLVLSAETLKAASAILEEEITRHGTRRIEVGKVIIGTVKGDLHDIGKTIVGALLTSYGFTVIDLGVDVSAEKFIEAIRREKPDVIGMSSLLTVTAKELANIITKLEDAELRHQVKVVVGGGAVTDVFAKTIGADGYGQNAGLGVQKIMNLLGLTQ